MEFVTAVIRPVVESLMLPVKKHIGYLFSSPKYVRNMRDKMKQLDGTSLDVKNHMDTNTRINLEIPARVPGWLEDVEKIQEDAKNISSDGNGCFNMKMRYSTGRNAFKISEEIELLIKENLEIKWSDTQKPLGKVSFKKASTSTQSEGNDAQNCFKSREKTFNDALKLLQQDDKTQVIALCGMGGVGKTTMMEQLKKKTEDKNMFDYIVKVVIGQKINMFSIQQTVAEYIGLPLTEKSKTARADRLRKTLGKMTERKKKFLIILDDVWEMVELRDFGLSPLPKGFKLLLTSRDGSICKQIAVEANLDIRVVEVAVMEESEANNFFCRITGVSKEYDPELYDIGCKIVKRCGRLPLAIKLIAAILKSQEKFVWSDTLHRLKKYDLNKNVEEIIEISYEFIKEEDAKAIFLLCGLFPDDFDIPIEDLTRYAWGLKSLNKVDTLGNARDRTKTCVQKLKDANLLINSDHLGCIKIHDLVLAFVVGKVSKGDQPWMINHGEISNWSKAEMSESYKRISLTCMGMSELPKNLKHPNLSLLKLMNGDKSLKFPDEFYDNMINLEVLAYDQMLYPLLPRSPQCSTGLRTLILHRCLLMFDCSSIGDLLNLEVLSFAHCGIRKLPSAIGNLKKLKLLDLTGCINLRLDDGILKNLVSLEELYMKVAEEKLYMKVAEERGVRFTNINIKELAKCSKNLTVLEVEFLENNAQLKNMSFEKLERFQISMGRYLKEQNDIETNSFENTLKVVTNKDELLESRVNELLQKTELLYLRVDGMNDLAEVLVEPVRPSQQSFYNLRVLEVCKCADLRYLFTVPMMSGLVKLEHLTISECPVMKVLAYSENDGAEVIRFQNLKYLYLDDLPMLVSFCNRVNVIELPQLVELELCGLPNFTSIFPDIKSSTCDMSSNTCTIQPFFNKEVMIPKLEILHIYGMVNLKDVWAYECSSSEEDNGCKLRVIRVSECVSLSNLFPSNPMRLLHHLEKVDVGFCDSLEVVFNIDMDGVCEIEKSSSRLREIIVENLGKLREIWRMRGVSNDSDEIISGFQAVERITIHGCRRFRNLFTPTVAGFDLRAVTELYIDDYSPVERTEEVYPLPITHRGFTG